MFFFVVFFQFKHAQLLLYIRKVRFVNNLGENYHFDGNGDSPGVYELLNWQSNDKGSMEFKMVGTYDLRAPINHKLQVNDVAIIWKGGKTKVRVFINSKASRNINLKPVGVLFEFRLLLLLCAKHDENS